MHGPHVTAWSNNPSASDGFSGARSLSVWTQPRYLWSAQPLTPAKLTAVGQWQPVRETALSFRLAEPAVVRLLYSMVARPDQVNATNLLNRRDDVGARLLVDGLPFRETSSILSLSGLISCAGVLEGEVGGPCACATPP
jgi:hypothetical protein